MGGWFTDKKRSGGGALIDIGVHRLDLALWLMGYPEPITVSGATYSALADRVAADQGCAFDVEDLACAMVRFRNGATLILEASWASNTRDNEHLTTVLCGDKGGLYCGMDPRTWKNVGEIYTEENGSLFTKRLNSDSAPQGGAMNEFISSIVEKRPPWPPLKKGSSA